jgi:site-specific recombinase XerD
MLERYFLRPNTVDKIRASWIGEPIEQYVTWLTEQNYSSRSVLQRVPLLLRFGAFAHSRGARNWAELPDYVEPFVDAWLFDRGQKKVAQKARIEAIRSIRGPIQHWLRLVVPGYCGGRRGYQLSDPFADGAPGFFSYLRSERGLRESTISQYIHQLRYFEAYLQKIKLYALSELSATVLSAFITERSQGFGKRAVQRVCGTLRVFLRYLYRENLISRDQSSD